MNVESIKTACAVIGAIIGVWSFIPYIKDIYRGKTKPHSYTWLIWTILQTTAVIGMISNGAGIGVLSLTIGIFFCAYVWILSFKYGSKNITPFDTFCLIGSLASIAVYIFLKSPLLAVIFVSTIDMIGFMPTLRKIYQEPHTETLSTFAWFIISGTLSVTAISTYSFITLIYPVSLIAANTVCTLLIFWRRKKVSLP